MRLPTQAKKLCSPAGRSVIASHHSVRTSTRNASANAST